MQAMRSQQEDMCVMLVYPDAFVTFMPSCALLRVHTCPCRGTMLYSMLPSTAHWDPTATQEYVPYTQQWTGPCPSCPAGYYAQGSYPLFGGVAEQGAPEPNVGAYNNWRTFSSKVRDVMYVARLYVSRLHGERIILSVGMRAERRDGPGQRAQGCSEAGLVSLLTEKAAAEKGKQTFVF